jgi:hypothetical protein
MKKFFALITLITLFTIVPNSIAAKRPSKTGTVAKIGVGTAIGAGIGALVGGGRGAAAGALIGGGALTAHSLAKRDSGYNRKTRMIGTIAAGSLVGTGLGAAIGGKKGAGIGALIGGGSSTVYALTRKDLKEPSKESFSRTRNISTEPQTNTFYNNQKSEEIINNRKIAQTRNINQDPYQRLSGSQGALVGNLLANGSSAVNQLSNNPY